MTPEEMYYRIRENRAPGFQWMYYTPEQYYEVWLRWRGNDHSYVF